MSSWLCGMPHGLLREQQHCYMSILMYDTPHHIGVSAAGWPGECTAGICTLCSAPDAGLSTFLSRSNGMQGEQQDRGVQ